MIPEAPVTSHEWRLLAPRKSIVLCSGYRVGHPDTHKHTHIYTEEIKNIRKEEKRGKRKERKDEI
jgi:hypothetical protein